MNSFNLHNLVYKDFFSKATGNELYPYQEAFHQRELSSFTALTAPTGAGKTETFTCDWLYGRVCGVEDTPTKLVVTSPLKTLVEQTYERVLAIVENLGLEDRISVYLLMGGKVENKWDNDPSREIILIGTQDQILSRQLNRGYCLNKTRWPIHFAALNNDCRIVVDETQLQGVGYKTAFYLQRFRDKFGCYGKTQLILCSATLDTSPIDRAKAEQKLNENKTEIKIVSCSVGDDDFNHSQLAKRLKKSKALFKAKTVWLGESNSQFINSLKKEILEHYVAGSLTLVVLNRVESVQKLYQSLQSCLDERATSRCGLTVQASETSDDAPSLELKLLHSRFRKGERLKLVENLIDFKGIIIATQCVEAGIDLDAKLLFTQLCPWSSFVQRCGRAGRKGSEEEVKIFWINHSSNNKYHAKPYELDELQKSRSLIKRLKDASIKNLLAQPLPPQITNCDNLSAEALKQLFHTQLEDSDLDFGKYIREAINDNVYVAWRNFSGAPSPNWQIQEIEVCSVPISKIRKFPATGWQYNASEETWSPISTDLVSAGSTILFPCRAGGYLAKLGFTGNVENIPTELEITLPQVNDKSDRSSFSSARVTLKQHSLDVAREMEQLAERLKLVLPAGFKEYLVEIAQWHDVGKAHEIFQETIGGDRDELLAKSPQIRRRRHRRRGFRHELASALAALIEGKPFIFAYLVCCHHGKVRTKLLRDIHLNKDSDFLNLEYHGVREGDVLPVMDLGSPIGRIDSLTLSYQRNDTNLHPDIWWKRKCQESIDDPNMGIFRLAYLETLIRCADAIASSKYK